MLECLINRPSFIPTAKSTNAGSKSLLHILMLSCFSLSLLFYLFIQGGFFVATQLQWTLCWDFPLIEKGSSAGSSIRSRVRFMHLHLCQIFQIQAQPGKFYNDISISQIVQINGLDSHNQRFRGDCFLNGSNLQKWVCELT